MYKDVLAVYLLLVGGYNLMTYAFALAAPHLGQCSRKFDHSKRLPIRRAFPGSAGNPKGDPKGIILIFPPLKADA